MIRIGRQTVEDIPDKSISEQRLRNGNEGGVWEISGQTAAMASPGGQQPVPTTHPSSPPPQGPVSVCAGSVGKPSASQGAGRDASPGRALPLFFVLTSEGILKVGGQDPPSAMLGLQGLTSNKFSNRFLQALYPLTWILTDSVAPRGL